MQDLSHLAADSMTATSQEGGNLVHDNGPAMTAPGSRPVTPMPGEKAMPDPQMDMGAKRPAGTQEPRRPRGYAPSPRQWKKTGD